jgi:hypothetical protein
VAVVSPRLAGPAKILRYRHALPTKFIGERDNLRAGLCVRAPTATFAGLGFLSVERDRELRDQARLLILGE